MCDGRVFQDMIEVIDSGLVENPNHAFDYMLPIYFSELEKDFFQNTLSNSTLASRTEELIYLLLLITNRDNGDCHHMDSTCPCLDEISLMSIFIPDLETEIAHHIGYSAPEIPDTSQMCWCGSRISKYEYLARAL